MLKQLIIVWLVVAAAIAITAWLLPSVEVDGGPVQLLLLALLFGLVNALIGTLLRLISLPLTLMTFGLFGLVINGVLLAITAGLTDVLDVGGFLATILAAVVISIVTTALLFLVGRLFGEPETATGRTGCVGTEPSGHDGHRLLRLVLRDVLRVGCQDSEHEEHDGGPEQERQRRTAGRVVLRQVADRRDADDGDPDRAAVLTQRQRRACRSSGPRGWCRDAVRRCPRPDPSVLLRPLPEGR